MEVQAPTKISSVSWSGRGEILGVGDDFGIVRIYDVEKSKLIRTYSNHLERVGSLDWNGFLVTSGSKDKNIILSDIRQ
jgi:cell division cycle 20-like protein 1 (cofactor of APC complex)